MIDKEPAVPPPTVHLPRRGRLGRQLVLFAAIFVVAALVVVAARPNPVVVMLGVITLLLSGLLVVVGLNAMIRQTPLLVLDADGLEPRSWDGSTGTRSRRCGPRCSAGTR
ncbi:hypothetical protein ACFYST_05170 [Kitasatospora sp. NPDC004614]|uniref:hypothetical protein n=1 Tax=unclassified Kitasatospora TaxID=2633591 RepID=UPI00368487B9